MKSVDTQKTAPIGTVLARFTESIETLCKLVQQETIAVKAVDTRHFSTFQSPKIELMALCQDMHRTLAARKDELKALPETEKEKLRAIEKKFNEVRTDSLTALDMAQKSFSRLRARIVDAAKTSALQRMAKYGANGSLQTNVRKAVSMGIQDHA